MSVSSQCFVLEPGAKHMQRLARLQLRDHVARASNGYVIQALKADIEPRHLPFDVPLAPRPQKRQLER